MAKLPGCPTDALMQILAGRWKLMVIYYLMQGERRFNELQRSLGPITHRTLAQQLRELERDGLVARRDHGTIPPRVDYRLTALGQSLSPILLAMQDWAETHGLGHSKTVLPKG